MKVTVFMIIVGIIFLCIFVGLLMALLKSMFFTYVKAIRRLPHRKLLRMTQPYTGS